MTIESKLNAFLDRFCSFNTRRRKFIFIGTVIISMIFSMGLLRIQSEVVISDLFPYDHPYIKMYANFSKVFGGGGTAAVIAVSSKEGDIFNADALTKVKKITEELLLWPEVYRQLTTSMASLSTKVVRTRALGEITFDPLMFPEVPQDDHGMAELKKNVFSNPEYDGSLVSYDGKSAIILTEFKENISYQRVYELLNSLIKRYSDEQTDIRVTGFPMLMGYIYSLKPQMRIVFGVSIVLMILILYMIFRNITGMITPIIVGLLSTVIGLGFVGFIKINFSPLLYVLAFLVGARIISHSVQITHRYFEELHASSNNREKACYETMRTMLIPNVAGVVTDAAGFLVLIFAKIVLMQNIAVIMTFWMMSIAFSAIITPIICSFIPLRGVSEIYSKKRHRMSFLDRINTSLAFFSIGRGRYVLGPVLIVLLIVFIWQAANLKIGDPTPGTPLLWPEHKYNQDQEFINSNFKASSETFTLYWDGEPHSTSDAQVMATFESFDHHMKTALPDIYKFSMSMGNLAKMVNLTFHDGDEIWFELPFWNSALLVDLLGQTRAELGVNTVLRYWNYAQSRSQLTQFYADHTTDSIIRIREASLGFFKEHPMKLKNGEFKLAGGGIGQEIALNEEMKDSHLKIDLMVMAAILIMCALSFQSIVAGIMLTLPLWFANLGAFAYMSTMDIGLSVNTLPVAAVGVGIGVDFAIYLYSRCVEEYSIQQDWTETIMVSVRTCGKAIVFTGLVLVLSILPWFFISELKFQAQMGFFLSMLLGINVILAMTLHPLLIYMIKPRFIKKGIGASLQCS